MILMGYYLDFLFLWSSLHKCLFSNCFSFFFSFFFFSPFNNGDVEHYISEKKKVNGLGNAINKAWESSDSFETKNLVFLRLRKRFIGWKKECQNDNVKLKQGANTFFKFVSQSFSSHLFSNFQYSVLSFRISPCITQYSYVTKSDNFFIVFLILPLPFSLSLPHPFTLSLSLSVCLSLSERTRESGRE